VQIKIGTDRTAEVVNTSIRNVDGAGSITVGRAACLAVNGSSVTVGAEAVFPAAALRKAFAGIAIETIAINAWGRVRSWGQVASCLVSNEGSSVTITAADACIPINSAGISSVGGDTADWLNSKYVISTQTITVSAVVYLDNAQVRAL